jgi:hypothetical protein
MTLHSNFRWVLVLLLALVAIGGPAAAHADDSDTMIALDPQTLKFIEIPDMPACATAAILRGNPRFGPAWVPLKLASGCEVPWHRHTANESLVVISGRGSVAMKDGPTLRFVPGAYTSLPNHHPHKASCSRTCLLFNTADAAFDINYVDANGQKISADEALKARTTGKTKKK